VHATQRFPAVSKGSFESACAICNKLLMLKRFLNSLHFKSKARNLSEPDEDMRVAISNNDPHYSMTIKKKQKSHQLCLIVGVLYCKFIVLLYRCNEIVLVSITI